MAAKAIEMELAYASFGDSLAVHMWGPAPELPRATVSVPRSLRRYFGRTVEVAAPRRGRRVKRPPRRNRRERPDCECRE